MAHFAKVVNNIVTQVIVAEQQFIETMTDNTPGQWIQTSYNTRGGVHYDPNTGLPSEDQTKALRKNYAGVGYIYNSVKDIFYEPQPFPSWTFDEETCFWNPPIPRPEGRWIWLEDQQQWVKPDQV